MSTLGDFQFQQSALYLLEIRWTGGIDAVVRNRFMGIINNIDRNRFDGGCSSSSFFNPKAETVKSRPVPKFQCLYSMTKRPNLALLHIICALIDNSIPNWRSSKTIYCNKVKDKLPFKKAFVSMQKKTRDLLVRWNSSISSWVTPFATMNASSIVWSSRVLISFAWDPAIR